MPDPKEFTSKDDFMKVCVRQVMGEGKSQEQAVGQCMGMWDHRSVPQEGGFLSEETKGNLLNFPEGEATKIAKREDVNPKDGTSEYGDVRFADPKNHKYPIDTAEHIHAAWNYINKEANSGKYSAEDARKIKDNIIRAWKEKIDKDGPPSEQSVPEDVFTQTPTPEYEKVGSRHSAQDRKDMQTMHDIAVRQGADCQTRTVPDNALKTISKTDTELRVGNHILLFGGRDLTGHVYGKNADGSLGEFFTPETNVESEYTKTGMLHVDFEHGKDPDGVGNNKDNVLGYVDWKTAKATDEGIFVERVLNRRKRYVKWLEKLIDEGLVGNSTEAIGSGVEKKDSGEITKWPLRRDTLTVNPMEPRMLSQNALQAIKALSLEFPNLKSLLPPDEDDTALTDPALDVNQKTIKGDFNMDEQELKTAVSKQVAEIMAQQEAEAKAKAEAEAKIKAAEDAGYKKAMEEVQKKGFNKFAINTQPLGFSEEKDAVPGFTHWMKTGQVNGALISPDSSYGRIPAAKGAGSDWNVTDGGTGGYLVPDPLYGTIIAKRNLASWVRQAPVQHFTTPADHLLVPRESTSHTAFVLTTEGSAYDENEGTVTQKDLILYKYTKQIDITEEFLAYNQTNFEGWLAQALGRAEAVTENTIFTSGTGSGDPEGFSTGATASGLTIKTTKQLNPEDLTALIGNLPAGYNVQAECGFLMANASKWYVKNAILSGPFAFAAGSVAAGAPDFFGYPCYVSDDVTAYTSTSAIVMLFGNMTFYGVVEKPGMLVQRNPWLKMANGLVSIFANIYRGGGVLQAEAVRSITGKS